MALKVAEVYPRGIAVALGAPEDCVVAEGLGLALLAPVAPHSRRTNAFPFEHKLHSTLLEQNIRASTETT